MGYTIAICDDDKTMADKLTVSLKNEFTKAGRNDVIIDYYDTGVQLLEALKNKMYKAVLLDINMEPMDGFSVAEDVLFLLQQQKASAPYLYSHCEDIQMYLLSCDLLQGTLYCIFLHTRHLCQL